MVITMVVLAAFALAVGIVWLCSAGEQVDDMIHSGNERF